MAYDISRLSSANSHAIPKGWRWKLRRKRRSALELGVEDGSKSIGDGGAYKAVPPLGIAKLVQITPMSLWFVVDISIYLYYIWDYKPTYNWRGITLQIYEKNPLVNQQFLLVICLEFMG